MLPLWARVDLGAMAMKGTPHSPKLQHFKSVAMRFFSVINRTLAGGGLIPQQRSSRCILQSQQTGLFDALVHTSQREYLLY